MVGANVGISSTILWVCQSITIGNNVKIGGGSILMDTDAHSLHYMDRRDVLRDDKHRINQSIVIDDDVFIGTHSIILKGVHIGARSIEEQEVLSRKIYHKIVLLQEIQLKS